jgi:hypothetical protein
MNEHLLFDEALLRKFESQKLREWFELSKPFHALKARIYMMIPVDLVIMNGNLEPRERITPEVQELLDKIDAAISRIGEHVFGSGKQS